ncbi:MAG TPA: transporter [Gemmatimonadaceae bacterium]|nr:transporter [Gemmatimonadaceae bacterium]
MPLRSRCSYATLATAFFVAVLFSSGLARVAHAQLKGHYVPGFTGLENGTQAPPGITFALPVYFYTTDQIKDDNGNSIGAHPRTNVTFTGPAIAWVTHFKLLGANFGGAVVPLAFIKSRIEGPSLDVPGSFAFTDIEIEPVQLGWVTKHADFVFDYGLFIPTGKWENGGSDNSGLGMWSNLFQAGTTIHLDNEHKWSFSTLGSYEIHSRKKSADITVGDILTIESGLGRAFYKIGRVGGKPFPVRIINLGVVSYEQFKVTGDKAGLLTPLLSGVKDRVFAAGLEGNVILPLSKWVFDLRAEPEFGARNRTQGWTFLLTTAYII